MSNPLLMVQTRFTGRPLHKEFVTSLTKRPWVGTEADFGVALQGPYQVNMPEDALINAARIHNQIQHILDLRAVDSPGTGLPTFLYHILTWMMDRDYPYIGVFDDDAVYPKPAIAAKQITTAFDIHKKCGGVGPMGNLRKQWRYRLDEGREPNFLEPLYRCPWACLGSQIYRADALRTLDLSFLFELKFRADALIALLLVGKGWENYEMDIPFGHTVSAGLDGRYETPQQLIAFHERRISQVSHDYQIYREVLKAQTTSSFYARVEPDLVRLEMSERKHNEKKLRNAEAMLRAG